MKTRPLLLIVILIILSACTADLRNQIIIQEGATDKRVEAGKKLLERAVRLQGGMENWKRHQTTRVILRDRWRGLLMNLFLRPWPENNPRLKIEFINNTFNSRLEFLDGPQKGEIWGIQSSKTYRQKPGGQPEFKNDKTIKFMLPTIQFFVELPFRLHLDATQVAHMGIKTKGRQGYDLVLATWGKNLAPSPDHDQYVVWINRQTHLVEKAAYTVRDMMGTAEGCVHYRDFRKIDGIKLPFKHSFTTSCEDDPRDPIHYFSLKEVTFDAVSKEDLLPDKTLPYLTGKGKPKR